MAAAPTGNNNNNKQEGQEGVVVVTTVQPVDGHLGVINSTGPPELATTMAELELILEKAKDRCEQDVMAQPYPSDGKFFLCSVLDTKCYSLFNVPFWNWEPIWLANSVRCLSCIL